MKIEFLIITSIANSQCSQEETDLSELQIENGKQKTITYTCEADENYTVSFMLRKTDRNVEIYSCEQDGVMLTKGYCQTENLRRFALHIRGSRAIDGATITCGYRPNGISTISQSCNVSHVRLTVYEGKIMLAIILQGWK